MPTIELLLNARSQIKTEIQISQSTSHTLVTSYVIATQHLVLTQIIRCLLITK